MPDEPIDKLTQRHASVLADEYNLAPNATKCERTLRLDSDIATMWLANSDGTVRCLIKYHSDELIFP